ncbi:MAG: ankyrin repeat domain-containing protein [Gemmatimonadota bacterium]|nr:ankyrin repeat domain-containing protein [Gemmatimonadota bacterium]
MVSSAQQADDSHPKHVAWFLENACPDHHVRGGPEHVSARHTAMRILTRYPEIAHDSFSTAVVCGDIATVERVLAERPSTATEKSSTASPDRARAGHIGDLSRELGPKGWEPLLYLCFTRLPLPAANDNAVAIARALLDRGADPNVYFMAGDSRYSPLVGAIGEGEENRPPHPQRDALVRLLLERGAEPYDMQVIYNIHFHGNVLWFLELIHAHAMKLGRKADWDDPEWSMLDMGGYGSGARWHLDLAVAQDDLELAEWVLAHGANPNAAPARDPRLSQRTLYEEAVRRGNTEMADLLERHGAIPRVPVLEGIESFVAACLRLEHEAAREYLDGHPEYLRSQEAMFEAAKRDRADVVAFLLALGMNADVQNQCAERPLHIAAYAGSLRVAELLIERGAEIDPVESNWGNTPLGAAVYAQQSRMIALLGRYSRDLFELTYAGNVERVRELLNAEPEGAKIVAGGHTPLMWLPPTDEALAMEIAELFLARGADPAVENKQGQTAADCAERLALFDVAARLRAARRVTPDTSSPRTPPGSPGTPARSAPP